MTIADRQHPNTLAGDDDGDSSFLLNLEMAMECAKNRLAENDDGIEWQVVATISAASDDEDKEKKTRDNWQEKRADVWWQPSDNHHVVVVISPCIYWHYPQHHAAAKRAIAAVFVSCCVAVVVLKQPKSVVDPAHCFSAGLSPFSKVAPKTGVVAFHL